MLKGEPRKEDGRLRYTLRHESGSYIRKYGSYFILLAFSGPRKEGDEARHLNGNCLDDRHSNLCWGSSVENKADMLLHGTRRRGSQIYTVKLTEADVLEIRQLRCSGLPLMSLANKYNVTLSNISSICNRKTWKHL